MLDNPAHKSPTAYKLVCLLPEEKVIGVHIVGEGSDEIMQFVGVAVKMGGKLSFTHFLPPKKKMFSSIGLISVLKLPRRTWTTRSLFVRVSYFVAVKRYRLIYSLADPTSAEE